MILQKMVFINNIYIDLYGDVNNMCIDKVF